MPAGAAWCGQAVSGVRRVFLNLSMGELAMRSFLTIAAVFASAACCAQTGNTVDVGAATELAKANGCYSCHAAAEKVVGPAFSAIAEKYKDDKDAVASLVQSIQYGSKGKWGRIPMPAHASLAPADLKVLAVWVLATPP